MLWENDCFNSNLNRPMTSHIKHYVTSRLFKAKMYNGIHPNIHHPCNDQKLIFQCIVEQFFFDKDQFLAAGYWHWVSDFFLTMRKCSSGQHYNQCAQCTRFAIQNSCTNMAKNHFCYIKQLLKVMVVVQSWLNQGVQVHKSKKNQAYKRILPVFSAAVSEPWKSWSFVLNCWFLCWSDDTLYPLPICNLFMPM